MEEGMNDPKFEIGDKVFYITPHQEVRLGEVTAASVLGDDWRYEVPGLEDNVFGHELYVTFKDAVKALRERREEPEKDG
jgi:hypothetical protein